MEEVLDILKQNKNYSIEDLKKVTKLDSVVDLVNYLLNLFMVSISTTNDNSYLFKMFELLSELFKDNYFTNNSTITNKINMIMGDLKEEINNPLQKDNTNYIEFLKESFNRFENLDLALAMQLCDKYNGDNISLISYLVFKVRNLELFESLLNTHPYIVSFKDDNENTIYELVIKEYLNEIFNDCDRIKLFYYDEILSLIIASKKFDNNDELKERCKSIISSSLNENKKRGFTKQFWLDQLKQRIEGEISYDNLNIKYGIKSEFENYLSRFASSKKICADDGEDRTILDEEYIITIDDEDACEIDDGISVKKIRGNKFILGVHIADPLGYLHSDSPFIEEASKRVISIYAPNHIVRLFPEELTKKHLSLVPNEYRYAHSYFFEIDEHGNITDYNFLKTIIRSSDKLSYKEIGGIYDKNSRRNDRNRTIDDLGELFSILKQSDKTPDYDLFKKQTISLSGNKITGDSLGETVVERAMFLVNNTVAQFFHEKKYPFIYRTHVLDKEIQQKIQSKLQNASNYKDVEKEVLLLLFSNYSTAKYDYVNLGHSGLNVPAYCHTTSPLRRYPDILANECLDTFYFGTPTDEEAYELEDTIKEQIPYINSKIETAGFYIRDSIRAKQLSKKRRFKH